MTWPKVWVRNGECSLRSSVLVGRVLRMCRQPNLLEAPRSLQAGGCRLRLMQPSPCRAPRSRRANTASPAMKPLDRAEGVKSLYAARASRRSVCSERHYRSVRQLTVIQIRHTGSANSNNLLALKPAVPPDAAPRRPQPTVSLKIHRLAGHCMLAKLHANPPSPYVYKALKNSCENADRSRTSRPFTRHPGTIDNLLVNTKCETVDAVSVPFEIFLTPHLPPVRFSLRARTMPPRAHSPLP